MNSAWQGYPKIPGTDRGEDLSPYKTFKDRVYLVLLMMSDFLIISVENGDCYLMMTDDLYTLPKNLRERILKKMDGLLEYMHFSGFKNMDSFIGYLFFAKILIPGGGLIYLLMRHLWKF